MSNKNNGGWNSLNEDKFDQDENSRRVAEADEKHGFGRLTDDCASIHLKSDLLKLASSDNPDAVAMLREAGIESLHAHRPFHLSDGTVGDVFADANGTWHAVVTIAGEELDFAGRDRDGVMMSAEQHAAKNRGPRELTETEKLRVSRLAQSGETAEAASLYVELRLDGQERRSEEAILIDPKLTWLLNDAAIFVWRCSRQDYLLDEEFEGLLERAAAVKPLNVRIVDALYDKYQDQKTEATRATRRAAQPAVPEHEPVPSQEQVTAELETLSDSALEKLRLQTMRHRGHLVRQFDTDVLGR